MPTCPLTAFASWTARRWLVAAGTALATFLLLGLSTAVIPNPVFGRSVACPLHNWTIALSSGEAAAPDEGCTPYFSVRVQDGEVQLRADQTVPYGTVARIMGLAQQAGLSRIGFVAVQPAS